MQTVRSSYLFNEKIPSRETPLRLLVESIPARYWSLFNGVSLDRKLGFKTAMRFSNLHQLMRYIGWKQHVVHGERLAYEFYIDEDIEVVTLDELILSTESCPEEKVLHAIQKAVNSNA